MQRFHRVKNGQITASTRSVILRQILEEDGVNHPASIFERWPEAELKAIGVYPEKDGAKPAVGDLQEMRDTGPAYDADADDVVRRYQARDIPLDTVASRLKAKASQRYRAVSNGGVIVTVGGSDVALATTTEARTEIAAVRAATAGGGTQKAVTRSGAALVIDEQTAIAMLAAVDAHRAAAYEVEYNLVMEIDAALSADDRTAMATVDIDGAPWPANPTE